jgi:hypothetical protein
LPWCWLAWAKVLNSVHGQRVHVGAQAHGAVAGAVLDDAHHAGGAQAAVDGNAPFGELGRHHVGGAHFFEAQFGMGMDVTPDGGDAGGLGDDASR